MLYRKFISLVEDHAELLTQNWITEVKNNPSTPGYNKMPDDVLGTRIYDVYKRLGNWVLEKEPSGKERAEHFIKLGRERASEKLSVSEVIYAIILARVVLWKFISSQGIINTTIEFQQALGFYHTINNFFDKAAYFVAVGFETTGEKEQKKIEKEEFVDKAVKSITTWFMKENWFDTR